MVLELSELSAGYGGINVIHNIMGVDLVWTYLLSFIFDSAVVGILSILFSFYNQLNPDIVLQIYSFAVIAVVIGGTGSLSGTLLVGLSVGILQKVSVWKLPEEWSSFITFSVLSGIIILKPKGLFGLN